MYLVFDTETTGLPLWNQPFENKYQARVCQLACMLLDGNFKTIGEFCFLIKPDGWEIDPRAFEAHGIPQELCEEYGTSMSNVLPLFEQFMAKANYVIAHNLRFDSFLMSVELSRANKPVFDFKSQGVCTMLASTEICKIPHPSKRNTFKWPKLEEVYKIAFDVEHDNAHDAMADCKATACVFGWLMQQKAINLSEFQTAEVKE